MNGSMDRFSLKGRRILVTGASSGIGRQVAIDCASAGAHVVISGRDIERLQAVLEELDGIFHQSVLADLNDDEQIKALGSDVGKIDGVVHCAGVAGLSPMRQMTRKHIQHLLDNNLIGPVLLTRHLLANNALSEHGSILFISSLSAHAGVPGIAAYSSAKAGLEATTRSLAAEVARKKIRVNCIAPGLVRTRMINGSLRISGELDVSRYLLGIGEPEDVASAVIFLLSPASRWITGTTMLLDGGYSLG